MHVNERSQAGRSGLRQWLLRSWQRYRAAMKEQLREDPFRSDADGEGPGVW